MIQHIYILKIPMFGHLTNNLNFIKMVILFIIVRDVHRSIDVLSFNILDQADSFYHYFV